MKTAPLDFLLSTLVLALLAALAIGATVVLIDPLAKSLVGAYHVLLNAFAALLIFGLLAAASARLLLRLHPIRPGLVSMDSPTFTYWKLFTVMYEFGRGALLPFTTVFARPLIATLFGARIGKDIALGGRLVDPELIRIGDEAIIGQDSVLTAHAIVSGRILFAEVVIGSGATVGVNVVIMPGVQLGAGSVVAAGAVVPPHTIIPPGEFWGGIPARKIKDIDA